MLIGEKIFRDYVKYHTGYTGNIYTLWDFLRKTDFSSLTVYSIEFPLPENLEQAKRIYEKVRWIDSSYGNFIADDIVNKGLELVKSAIPEEATDFFCRLMLPVNPAYIVAYLKD